MANEKKNAVATAIELTADELKAQSAVFALVQAGMADHIDSFLAACGMATTQEEHEAARPLSKAEIAEKALAACGVDIKTLEPAKPAKAKKLALCLDALAKAAGKYGKHAVIYDKENGTSCVSHYMLQTLATTGRVTLADTLAFARKTLPSYSSTGHYNSMKRLFKEAGYKVNVSQGAFSITA